MGPRIRRTYLAQKIHCDRLNWTASAVTFPQVKVFDATYAVSGEQWAVVSGQWSVASGR